MKLILNTICLLSFLLISVASTAATEADLLPFMDKTITKSTSVIAAKDLEKELIAVRSSSSQADKLSEKAETSGAPWLRMMAAFLFVSSLIVVGAFLAKKHLGGLGASQGSKMRDLKVMTMLPLGLKRHLAVVQFGKKRLVVGITSNNIQLLYVEPDDPKEQLREQLAAQNQQTTLEESELDASSFLLNSLIPSAEQEAPSEEHREVAQASYADVSALANKIRKTVKQLRPLSQKLGAQG